MLWCIITISTLAASVLGAPTLESCTIGEKWVSNYIVMECYKDATISKGVRPIGCSPSNQVDQPMITADQTHKDKYFVFKCMKTGANTMAYQAINCIASDGTVMPLNSNHTDAKGTVWTCTQNGQEAKLTYSEASGCTYNGKLVKPNDKITVPSTSQPDNPLTGIVYVCQLAGGKYQMQLIGCAIPEKVINRDTIGEFDGKQYRCISNGQTVILERIDNNICNFKGRIYQLDAFWNDEETMQQYKCVYNNGVAEVYIYGCMIYLSNDPSASNNIYIITRNTVAKISGKYYQCVKGDANGSFWHLITLTSAQTSCGLVNGTERHLFNRWIVNSTEFYCTFGPKVTITACVFPENPAIKFAVNNYKIVNETLILGCKLSGNVAVVYYITGADYDALFGSQNGGSGSIDGAGGAGGGGAVTVTTTKAPAPTTTTPKTPSPTTTTPKAPPTTTTKSPITPLPTTPSTPVTKRPQSCSGYKPQNGGTPTCELSEIPYGANMVALGCGTVEAGQTQNIQCRCGFAIFNTNRTETTITCNSDGRWSSISEQCARTCSYPPPMPSDGRYLNKNLRNPWGHKVYYNDYNEQYMFYTTPVAFNANGRHTGHPTTVWENGDQISAFICQQNGTWFYEVCVPK